MNFDTIIGINNPNTSTVFLVNILIPKIMKSKTMLIVLLGLYISKAYVHYYGILDYVTSDLLFFSLARIAFNTGNKKSINTIVTAVIFVVTNCLYSYFYVTQMPSGVLKGVLYLIRSISSVTGIMTVCNISKHLQNNFLFRNRIHVRIRLLPCCKKKQCSSSLLSFLHTSHRAVPV